MLTLRFRVQMRAKMTCGRGQKPPYQSERQSSDVNNSWILSRQLCDGKKVDRARRVEEGVEVWQQRIITVNQASEFSRPGPRGSGLARVNHLWMWSGWTCCWILVLNGQQ